MFLGNRLGLSRVRPLAVLTVPESISGLDLWLDFTDQSTLNGGSISNNDPISVVADKSPSGFDLAQGTGGSQPTWKSTGFGSEDLANALFDGGDWFDFDSTYIMPATATAFYVYKRTGAYAIMMAGGTTAYGAQEVSPKIYTRNSAGGFGTDGLGGEYNTNDKMVTTLMLGASSKVWVDQVDQGGAAQGAGSSAYVDLGQRATIRHTGEMCEIIVYDNDIGATDRGTIETYLKAKYGI